MPVINVQRGAIYEELGSIYSPEAFDRLCFDFGIEFDGEERDEEGNVLYRVELPANRTDLLSVEGLGRALRAFITADEPPTLRLAPTQHQMHVAASTAPIRPFGFAAVLRGVKFTPSNFKSFIDYQDKMHHNIGRRRNLVAIGTHDLNQLKPPFTYAALDPKSFKFVPLYGSVEPVDGHGMMAALSDHAQLKTYLPLIRDSPVYPVILDSDGTVASVPPIINSDHSKVTLETRDVFIEVTATDRTKGHIVIANLLSVFSKYASEPFTIEPVEVIYADDHPILGGRRFLCPDLKTNEFKLDLSYVRSITGIPQITGAQCCNLLRKMMLQPRQEDHEDSSITVRVPIYRADVMHPCDIAEDIAIAYGYNNIAAAHYESANELPFMALADFVRTEMGLCGYHEALTWGLVSKAESLTYLRRTMRGPKDPVPTILNYDRNPRLVQLHNPKTKEFEVARGTLIPGLLKSLGANKAQELPLRLFEIGEVCGVDPSTETRTRTTKYCAALYANSSGCGLEHVHGLLDLVLKRLGLKAAYDTENKEVPIALTGESMVYRLVPCEDEMFLPGRGVEIRVGNDVLLGVMGAIHPDVLKNFGSVTLPASLFEINLTPFLSWLPETKLYD